MLLQSNLLLRKAQRLLQEIFFWRNFKIKITLWGNFNGSSAIYDLPILCSKLCSKSSGLKCSIQMLDVFTLEFSSRQPNFHHCFCKAASDGNRKKLGLHGFFFVIVVAVLNSTSHFIKFSVFFSQLMFSFVLIWKKRHTAYKLTHGNYFFGHVWRSIAVGCFFETWE